MLHPLVALAMLVAIGLILGVPRKKAIVPFLLAFFTIPVGQVLVLGGVHLTMHQILILTVLGRMAAFKSSPSEKKFSGGFNAFDKLVVVWTLVSLVVFSLQFLDMQAVIKGLGDLVVSLGGYLAVRFLIPDREAVVRTVKVLAVVCIIQGVCMVSEQFTHQNVFGAFGANPPTMREGHIRSEGAMGTLYGGAMAGVLIPFFLWLWTEKKSRMAACAGLAGATAMVLRIARQHVLDGLRRRPVWPWLLASAQDICVSSAGDWWPSWWVYTFPCRGRFGRSLQRLT